MKESLDKYLTEKLFGECWHEYKPSAAGAVAEVYFGGTVRCSKCGQRNFDRNTPFTSNPWNKTFHSPEGFFRLWEKMQEQEDWNAFEYYVMKMFRIQCDCQVFPMYYINHQTFPRLVAEWTGWKE